MINFGILGTSEISRRSLIEASEEVTSARVLAIASRDPDRAAYFARKYEIPEHYADYNKIIDHPGIHAVYIPLVTSLHGEWAVKAIKANKHVLIEKPVCMDTAEVEKLRLALNKHPVVVMEAMMSQFHSWQKDLKAILENKPYGELLSLETTSQYLLPEEDTSFRTKSALGGGVFREEGNVWLQLVQLCFGTPFLYKQVEAEIKAGIDLSFKCRLEYENNRYTQVSCAYNQPYKAEHKLQFETTLITVQNFWRPTFGANKLRLNFVASDHTRKHLYAAENYYVNQLKYFVTLVNQKQQDQTALEEAFERVRLTEQLYQSVKITSAA